jgi:phosphoribosylglycinamide formyltransferase 1
LDIKRMTERRLAVFASGGGSNFQAIHEGWRTGRHPWQPVLVIANRSSAGVLERARQLGVPAEVYGREHWGPEAPAEALLAGLAAAQVEAVALAGFLKRVPRSLVEAYRGRMLNIHPALLPAFGGPGMYGHHVHEAVHAAGCRVSGATVHFVDEDYDRGPILLQRCVDLDPADGPDEIAARVLAVEHDLYCDALARLAVEGRLETGWSRP